MNHYAIDQWVDFTRGLLGIEIHTEMDAHLRSGCQQCRQLADFTAQLSVAFAGLATDAVPESAVRLARAIFPVRVPDQPKRGGRLPVEVVFDSYLAHAPGGLRAGRPQPWQGLYRAGDCSVDLRIEPELMSSRAAVVGQIASHILPEFELADLPVGLRSGDVLIAETRSNRFGEFQLEYDQQSRLKLRIDLRDSKSIQLPLKKVIFDQIAARNRTSLRTKKATPR